MFSEAGIAKFGFSAKKRCILVYWMVILMSFSLESVFFDGGARYLNVFFKRFRCNLEAF